MKNIGKYITPSKYQSSLWRRRQSWYNNGLNNECEIYQTQIIKYVTNCEIEKTKLRFNIMNNKMMEINHPHKYNNGYEFSENIDLYQKINGYHLYYNLKMICSNGGFQSRTLQNLYFYINCQLNYLNENSNKKIKFINILDGQECYHNIHKFFYLKNKKEYIHLKKDIYIGDLYDFPEWFHKNVK